MTRDMKERVNASKYGERRISEKRKGGSTLRCTRIILRTRAELWPHQISPLEAESRGIVSNDTLSLKYEVDKAGKGYIEEGTDPRSESKALEHAKQDRRILDRKRSIP